MDYSKLKSGTDIRGVAVEGAGEPVTLTDEVVETIAAAFLVWAQRHLGKDASALKIAIGHDSRVSADRISAALQRVFVRYGVQALDCGLASTPSMFWATLDLPCDCSVQITASHHPYHRNGLKFFTPQGGLDAPDITEILALAQEGARPEREAAGTVEPCGYMKDYAARLRRTIQEGVQAPDYDHPLEGFHIVVDAGNGAGGFYARDVLAPLGADVSGSQFLEPDGMFPNHIPNPENKEAMRSVSEAVKGFVENLVEAVVIVIVVLLVFMGLKSGLLIGFVLFLTICGTLFVMNYFQIALQRVSLGALIIALGMLVDNAIVITEGMMIRIRQGEDKIKAAREVVGQTMWPLLGATAIAVTAFGAIGLSEDSTGEFCGSLFYVLLISLTLSWITAITITPLLCYHSFRKDKAGNGASGTISKPQRP